MPRKLAYRELLMATLAGDALPVTPVSLWLHHPGLDQDGETLGRASVEFQRAFDLDFSKITPASTYQVRDYGLTDTWDGDRFGRRTVVGRVVAQADDLWALPDLNPQAGFVGGLLRAAVVTRRSLPSAIPVLMTVFNPVFQLGLLAGAELFAALLRDFPAQVRAGLGQITANTLRLIAALVDTGIDGIYFATQHAQPTGLSLADYREYALPGDRACLAAAAALPCNVLHVHGAAVYTDLLGDWAGLPVAILHYDTQADNPPPAFLTRCWPGGISTGLSHTHAVFAESAARVAAATGRLLAECRGPRFVLGAGCALPLVAGTAQIAAIVDAARSPSPAVWGATTP
ncbi:uroporphyrinogen decarboxylase [Methylomagnum ishizawai]|uniref:Uroporphyrinogen decarboxylase n=1 Tax=Methylomagnum ishizawai TaxID=1760988 RepID=A0A1Y6CSU9_9GAMM|nr:uroporphyrinogen decarboxylase family protein [Methylomagnum ishizawai]SMF93377.1 uroporphyrinogen decarboxylase [Methylomagnum ishizawai]